VTETTPITNEQVIFAPHRGERPNVYDGAPCPFCPGAEGETPPEICRDGDPWRVRVFPNRYPPTDAAEIVVESAKHDEVFDALAPDHAKRAIELTVERYHALSSRAAYVAVFKNHGRLAGASIPHLHSQLVGMPFVPPRIAAEGEAFKRAPTCPLCDARTHPLIGESENYRWIAPRGSRFAYQQWIVPKAHEHEIAEPRELASLMRASVHGMRQISDAFNWIFVNFPNEQRGHWYVELFPRTAMMAGLELGTGTFINTVEADKAAGFLRPFMR
jgi:UDPglucose--hexose-1-phosphate uridylyltransferase